MSRIKSIAVLGLLHIASLCFSQNENLTTLISANQWNDLFPRRAGTYGVHPQGYTTDFFSYTNLAQAVDEMSDYMVDIQLKTGVWGQLITITRVSNGESYIYSDVDPSWHTNPAPITTVHVNFNDFVNRSSEADNKRELAAFLANISKETTGGWQTPIGGGSEGDYALWGLYFVHEVGYNDLNSAGVYSQASTDYPPNPAVGYYGRGPIQLSWNYNYGQLSKFLYNDVSVLLDNPDLVQNDGVLAFKSAIWFWMMPQCPKPSCHQVMHDLWVPGPTDTYASDKMYKRGFAHTNNIINGGLECRSTSTPEFTAKVILRSQLYKYYMGIMGFSIDQIALEDNGDYTTLCYESSTNAMQDYLNCLVDEEISIDETQKTLARIYPNPTSEQLFIRAETNIRSIQFISAVGQIIRQEAILSDQVILDVSTLAAGIYMLKIYTDNGIEAKNVVITRNQ
jgi:basic endochitinase B